jgi:nucleoside-diphosphate-sugar epimerase
MLTHTFPKPEMRSRVVVLGSAGFVGAASCRRLASAGVPVTGLGRADVDLTAVGAAEALQGKLRSGDALVFVSAKAPCKNSAMLVENTQMAAAVCAAIKGVNLSHLVYVSSDAVYKDSPSLLNESSCAEPGSLHGVMHLAREVALRAEFGGPLAILRPTLIYGADDPHNGYGPNRFRRLAAAGQGIVLFGEGEERRDHVHVADVAELVCRIVLLRSTGILNAVSGDVASFRELAELTAAQYSPRVGVTGSPRSGPMPHDGYRPFDPTAIAQAFPDFRMTSWREGVVAVCKTRTP